MINKIVNLVSKGRIIRIILLLIVISSLNAYSVTDIGNIKELQKIQKNIKWLDNEIKTLEKRLRKKMTYPMRKELERNIWNLRLRNKKVKHQFIEIISKIEISEEFVSNKAKKRDLLGEIQFLLMPVVDSLRRASERPRKIEGLKSEIESIEKSLQARKKAKNRITFALKDPKYKELIPTITKSADLLDDQIMKSQIELDSIKRVLQKELGAKTSLMETAQGLFKSFFRTKGKNLFLSFIFLILIYWGLAIIRKRIFRLSIFNHKLEFLKKSLEALYNIISIIFAWSGAILCLYILNDWVLVTIIIIIIIGLLWSLKQFIPKFINEAKLILNVGSVRENERIIYNGIPWKVVKLGFYSRLVNERLAGGMQRVPVSELIQKQSRKASMQESWFPTQKGDWVLLDGDILGKIHCQTPEQVVLERKGSSLKYFSVESFLSKNPENISNGFVISAVLGLDYNIQDKILDSVGPEFKEKMQDRLLNHSLLNGKVSKFALEFHSAGGSSLNYWVKINCDGELASEYVKINRIIQESFVYVANEMNLTIPFEQLTIHQASPCKSC